MTKPHHFIFFLQYIDNLSTSFSKGITHNCISFSIQYHHIPLTLLKSAAYKWTMSLSQSPWGKTVIKNVNSEVCQNGRQSSMACLLQQRRQSEVKLDFCFERHRHSSLCQVTPKTAYWCSKTRFLPFLPYQPLVICGPAPFAAIKGIRLLNDSWSNMLYPTGCINTFGRINCPEETVMIPKGKRTLIGTVTNMAALGRQRK